MDRGPTGSTARETAVNSTMVWRDWPAASMGMENRSWLSPMGRSPRADVVGVRPGLSTHTSTFTVSDTVTCLLDTSMVAVNDVLPSDSMMAATIMHANTIAMVSSSCQLRIVNAMSEAMASPVTAHPSGDTYEVTSRLMRCLMRRRDRCMVLLRCMVLDCRMLDLSGVYERFVWGVRFACAVPYAAGCAVRFRRWRPRSVKALH